MEKWKQMESVRYPLLGADPLGPPVFSLMVKKQRERKKEKRKVYLTTTCRCMHKYILVSIIWLNKTKVVVNASVFWMCSLGWAPSLESNGFTWWMGFNAGCVTRGSTSSQNQDSPWKIAFAMEVKTLLFVEEFHYSSARHRELHPIISNTQWLCE